MNTIIGALIAAIISFGNALLAMFLNDPDLTFAMIRQAAWVGLIGGFVVQFFKDYQAITTRRMVSNLTGSGDGGGTL